jgi:HEPN domain-containing protein
MGWCRHLKIGNIQVFTGVWKKVFMDVNGVHILPFRYLRILAWNKIGLGVGFHPSTRPTRYISARLSYKNGLYPQFHWQSLQALEKYLKAILLYNRIKATDINHDLEKAIKYTEKLPFKIQRSESTNNFIKHLSIFARFRYLESSYSSYGPKIVELDKAVWEIRRYCKVIDYDMNLSDGKKNMLEIEIRTIDYYTNNQPPTNYKILGGLLEKIVEDPKHTSRKALIWQNAFFGKKYRKRVRVPTPFLGVNAPLYLHPEILDEVLKYVFLPKEVVKGYRELKKEKE